MQQLSTVRGSGKYVPRPPHCDFAFYRNKQRIKTNEHNDTWLKRFAAGVRDIPEVVEFYRMSGDTDYLLKIVVSDIDDYDRVYQKLITVAPMDDVSSSFAMERIKSSTAVPLHHLP